jgi:hypothetical protein
MNFRVNFTEVFYLSIFFTILALYFNIYGERNVLSFIISHVIALLVALIVSRVIYRSIMGRR